MSNNEMSNNEMSNNEMSNNEISNNEISNNKRLNTGDAGHGRLKRRNAGCMAGEIYLSM